MATFQQKIAMSDWARHEKQDLWTTENKLEQIPSSSQLPVSGERRPDVAIGPPDAQHGLELWFLNFP